MTNPMDINLFSRITAEPMRMRDGDLQPSSGRLGFEAKRNMLR